MLSSYCSNYWSLRMINRLIYHFGAYTAMIQKPDIELKSLIYHLAIQYGRLSSHTSLYRIFRTLSLVDVAFTGHYEASVILYGFSLILIGLLSYL